MSFIFPLSRIFLQLAINWFLIFLPLQGIKKSDGTSTKDFKTTKTRAQTITAFKDFTDGFPYVLVRTALYPWYPYWAILIIVIFIFPLPAKIYPTPEGNTWDTWVFWVLPHTWGHWQLITIRTRSSACKCMANWFC